MTKLEQLLKQREELNAQIEALENQVKMETYVTTTDWLEDNKEYYFISRTCGEEYVDYGCNETILENLIKEASVFKNKEQTTRVIREQKLRRKMEKFSEENGSANIDWNNSNTQKYCIFVDRRYDKIRVDSWRNTLNPFQIYFNTREVAEQALELFKEELQELFGI